MYKRSWIIVIALAVRGQHTPPTDLIFGAATRGRYREGQGSAWVRVTRRVGTSHCHRSLLFDRCSGNFSSDRLFLSKKTHARTHTHTEDCIKPLFSQLQPGERGYL